MQAAQVLVRARELADLHGHRPIWQKSSYKRQEVPEQSDVAEIVASLIPCENLARIYVPTSTPRILDSNGKYSYGLLMFQSSTWAQFSEESGIQGDPTDNVKAIQMALWAVSRGYAHHWSCAAILGIVESTAYSTISPRKSQAMPTLSTPQTQ